jgi:transposase, IS30 family
MGHEYCSTKVRGRGTHFTYDERLRLESYLTGTGRSQKLTRTKEIAKRLEKDQRTIQREIRRGLVEHMRSDLTVVYIYSAEYAQRNAEYECTAKGPSLKLGDDLVFVQTIHTWIVENKYSPYAVLQHLKNTTWPSELRICEKTLYTYIYQGLIGGVSPADLRYKGKRRKPLKGPHRHKRVRCAERSISKRPQEAQDRTEYGHWEIDTVVGPQGGAKSCLLTLTERKTRAEIVKPIPSRTIGAVVAAFDKMERKIGSKTFKEVFKSLTGDCGSEFMDYALLERSTRGIGQRTSVYYAHPYCSSERGSNENANGMIRRFFPKGTDFSLVQPSEIKKVQEWMNGYPRKVLGGQSAHTMLRLERGQEFCFP